MPVVVMMAVRLVGIPAVVVMAAVLLEMLVQPIRAVVLVVALWLLEHPL
jgi:hypothetical protein